jgi:putative DNA primase/helicase
MTLSARDTAFLAHDLGLSPVPPREDGSKRPADFWKRFQEVQAPLSEVESWFSNGRKSIGLACGVGDSECFEFDDRDTYEQFLETAIEAGLGELVDRVRTGYEEFTPSGGVHWLYRCSEHRGNTKLAERPDPTNSNKRKTLIETRGAGGFVIIAPSNGTVHPSGGAYTLVCGGLGLMTALQPGERDQLWGLAGSFDEMPVATPTEEVEFDPFEMPVHVSGDRFPKVGKKIGDDFAERTTWRDVLEPAGWKEAFTRGEVAYWRRPGKDRDWSATTGHCKGLKVFSSSTPFDTSGTHTKLKAYAVLNHQGDLKATAKSLAEKGYGTWIDDDGTERANPVPQAWFEKRRKAQRPAGQEHAEVDDSELAFLPHTDTGVAERMVARHGANIRHCHPWKKWMRFDGRRWALDDTAAIRRMAKATARQILAEASTIDDKEQRDALVKLARSAESKSRLGAMIDLASAEDGIPVLPKELDSRPWLLNVENGTIDLQTGKLRPHCRGDMITALAPVVYNPSAQCPLWEATLDKFFAKNKELIAFFDRLCGIALTGTVSEQILPILFGEGDNGKSTMVGALLNILSTDYAAIAPPNLILLKRADSHPTDRTFLFGKRLVVVMETPEEARLNESLIKQLTGSDPITARRMNEDYWTFDPTHKLWLCTNHKPVIKGTDHAIWRRPKLVPFEVKIPEKEKITDFPNRLRSEYSGILGRMVRGCLDWQKNGLGVPKEVSDATENYRFEQDSLRVFIEEECTTGPSCRAKAGVLYQRYREKTEHLGGEPISLTRFGLAMKERGFEKEKNNGIWYLDIGLNAVWSQTDDRK